MKPQPIPTSQPPLPIGRQFDNIRPLIEYYYKECPGTLLPLLFLFLARHGNLEVGERAREVRHTDDAHKYSGNVLAQFDREDALELGKTDPAGLRLLERWDSNEQTRLSIILIYDPEKSPLLQRSREVIQRHDEPLIQGTRKKKALFLLAQGLIAFGTLPISVLYQQIAAFIIRMSALFPDSDGYRVSLLVQSLLGEVSGKCYYPYAKLPFLANRLRDVEFTMEFSSPEKELDRAVAHLLVWTADRKKRDFRLVGKSFDSLAEGVSYDLVFSDWKDGERAFCTMLGRVEGHLAPGGRIVGVINPKVFFNTNCRQEVFRKKYVDTDLVESILLLPKAMDAVVVILRSGKEEKGVRLVNLYRVRSEQVLEWAKGKTLPSELEPFTKTVSVSDIQRRNYSVGEFFKYEVQDRPEFGTWPLRKLLSRIEKSPSSFGAPQDSLSGYEIVDLEDGRYDPRDPLARTSRFTDLILPDAAFILENDSLIFRKTGPLEPRIVLQHERPVLLTDGIALRVKHEVIPKYIVNELRKDYVLLQLNDWSHSTKGLHSTDEILDLKIHVPLDMYLDIDLDKQKDIADKELDPAYLPVGFVVVPEEDPFQYRIEKYLGSGCFGLTYVAERFLPTGEEHQGKRVALKEFFFRLGEQSRREIGENIVIHTVGSIDSIKSHRDEASEQRRFIDEAEMMMRFGRIPDSHIRTARSLFSSPSTNNLYFVMDFYENGDLKHFVEKHGAFGEQEAIERIIIPLAKALNILHTNRIVHLDLKPDNVMIDDEGYAVLADFGISKRYGEDGWQLTSGERGASGPFASPEEITDARMEFHPEMDIYSLGGILLWILTGADPDTYRFVPDILDGGISEGTRKAIAGALEEDPGNRIGSVMDFVHMLPGYEDAVFEITEPEDEEPGFDLDSLLYGDPEDGVEEQPY